MISVMQLQKTLGRQPMPVEVQRFLGLPQPTISHRTRQAADQYGLLADYPIDKGHKKQCFTITDYGAKVIAEVLSGRGEVIAARHQARVSKAPGSKVHGVPYRYVDIKLYCKLLPPKGALIEFIIPGRPGEDKDPTA
jgi:hypothetical protein